MNRLSEEQVNYLLNEYDVNLDIIELLDDVFSEYLFSPCEFYNLIEEIISEYQSSKINEEVNSELVIPYSNLKDIIKKVLNYKLRGITHESRYEVEVKSLILRLTDM